MIVRNVARLPSLLRRSLSILVAPSFPPPLRPGPLPIKKMTSTNSSGPSSASTPATSPDTDSPLQNVLGPAPPRPIPCRGVDYRSKIVLAPMVRSGELPSRLAALHYGADLVWGPETVDRSMIGTTFAINPRTGCYEWSRMSNNNKESVLYRIHPDETSRLVYQIGTNSPSRAVEAATLFAPYVAGIDVNAGCPKPFSTSGGMGAALLRTPDHLASILTALVNEIGIPHEIGISVKIRLLETPELTSHLVHTLCRTGITGLTIHCRLTHMRPRERAIREQLRMIGNICHSYGVACLMNGDVVSRTEGIDLAKEFGVDGAMIATAAEANSSVFLPDGPLPWPEVVSKYVSLALSVENRFGNTKFLLSQLIPGKSPVYQKVQMSKTYTEVIDVLSANVKLEGNIREKAKHIDEILSLNVQFDKKSAREIKKEMRQANRERQEANIARKRALKVAKREQPTDGHVQVSPRNEERTQEVRSESQERSKRVKAGIATENGGFEGAGGVAMAVAA
jgi:tRNA-dihydrouridine synthase 2